MYKFNGEIVSKKAIVITGVLALIDSLIPAFCKTDFMMNYWITIPLLFLSFPASGIYGIACFTGGTFAKIVSVLISYIVTWLIFLVVWTTRLNRQRQ